MKFNPPIAERTTDELIEIANFPDDWNPVAVEQTKTELLTRKVPLAYERKKVAVWTRYENKKREVTTRRKAREGFHWSDFILRLDDVLVEMLFDWDMKQDGYVRKHRQRKYTFAILALLVVLLYVFL